MFHWWQCLALEFHLSPNRCGKYFTFASLGIVSGTSESLELVSVSDGGGRWQWGENLCNWTSLSLTFFLLHPHTPVHFCSPFSSWTSTPWTLTLNSSPSESEFEVGLRQVWLAATSSLGFFHCSVTGGKTCLHELPPIYCLPESLLFYPKVVLLNGEP